MRDTMHDQENTDERKQRTTMENRIMIPQYILKILERFHGAGYEAFVAGGAVRDALSGEPPQDFDLCTSALPSETAALFSDHKVIETGILHGTVTVMADGHPVEVTTYRSDGRYSDGRHPDQVRFVSSLREDLARRDFTVNAMAWSPETGVIDYFGGREDLRRGILRCVGAPETRFSEDGLRIMRALRFLSVKGYQPDPLTREAMFRCSGMLQKVAYERIDAELLRFLTTERTAALLDEYREIFAVLIPELAPMFDFDQKSPYHNRDVWHHTLAAVNFIRPDPQLRMTMLLHDVAKPVVYVEDENGRGHFKGHQQKGSETADRILRRMRFPNAFREEIVTLVREHDLKLYADRPLLRRCLNRLGETTLRKLLEVQMADASGKYEKYMAGTRSRIGEVRILLDRIVEEGDCVSLSSLAVDGGDLLRAGIPAGKTVGDILSWLLEAVMEDRIPNKKEQLLQAARERAGLGIKE